MSEPKLTRNSAKCTKCDEEVESKHRHDFVWRTCEKGGNFFVDGGKDYLRRGGDIHGGYIDTSTYEKV